MEIMILSNVEYIVLCRFMMRNVRAVNLAMQDLTEIPHSVFQEALEAEVTTVDISKNKLKEVPEGYVTPRYQ